MLSKKGFDSMIVSLDAAFDGRGGGSVEVDTTDAYASEATHAANAC